MSEANGETGANNAGETQGSQPRKKLSFWQMMKSVIQASFGVQNQATKERDFQQGSITGFIVAALVFTFLFVMSLVLIVSLVLP